VYSERKRGLGLGFHLLLLTRPEAATRMAAAASAAACDVVRRMRWGSSPQAPAPSGPLSDHCGGRLSRWPCTQAMHVGLLIPVMQNDMYATAHLRRCRPEDENNEMRFMAEGRRDAQQ